MDEPNTEQARLSRADLIMAAVLIVLGLAILYGSWTMPRLEARRIHPMTVPGLVPGLLSIALILCGGVLGFRSLRARASGGWQALRQGLLSYDAMRALVAVALTLVFTLGLVGRVPFWAATGLFIFTFVVVFELWMTDRARRPLVTLGWALGLAVVISAIIFWVFQYQFLVRLPGS